MSKQMLLQGNYIAVGSKPTNPNQEYVTVVEFVGEEGECRLKVFMLHNIEFPIKWYPSSLRGYQQAAKVPEDYKFNMTDAVTRWNYRIPENSSIHFCETKEERDANLTGD